LKYGKGLREEDRRGGNIPVFGSNGIVGYHNTAVTKGQSIIIGRKGSIGEVALSNISCWPIDTTYYIDEVSEYIDLSWLFWALKFTNLPELNKGSTIPGLNRDDVYDLSVACPPLADQHEIVTHLEAQMAEAQRLRMAAERQIEAAQALQPAFLKSVFDDLANQNWSKVALGELGDIVSGITLGRKLANAIKTRSVPYLRVANVKDGFFDLSEVYEINATEPEIERYRLQYGDLLLTEGGDRDKLGRGTFWESQISDCIHQNHIFRVRFNQNQVLSQFASYQMESSYGKAYFLAHSKQTTGIATINQEVLSGFPFILPSVEEQTRIVNQLKPKLAQTQEIRKAARHQIKAITALPDAILQETFGGFTPPVED